LYATARLPVAPAAGRSRGLVVGGNVNATWLPDERFWPLQLDPEYHRATLGANLSMNDYEWSPDANRLALVSTTRHQAPDR
jgi:hypothetical protein